MEFSEFGYYERGTDVSKEFAEMETLLHNREVFFCLRDAVKVRIAHHQKFLNKCDEHIKDVVNSNISALNKVLSVLDKIDEKIEFVDEEDTEKDDFAKGVETLRRVDCPCSWQEFCELAEETLPGYVVVGDRDHHPEAHNQFYTFSVYSFVDESQKKLIGEDTFQVWLDLQPDGNHVITNIR